VLFSFHRLFALQRWLIDQHQQCPHCRTTLHLDDLVICRWAEEVTNQINHLQINEKQEEKDQLVTNFHITDSF